MIELLVAMAVTVLLIVLLAAMSDNVLRSHQKTVSGTAIERDATFALDLLAMDIGSLVIPRIGDAEALRGAVETVNGAQTCRLTLLTNAADRDPGEDFLTGSPRAVSYRVAWQDPITGDDAKPVFALYRAVASAEVTFSDATGPGDTQNAFWDDQSPTDPEHFLAGNVVDFRVRVLDPEDSAWREPAQDEFLRITSGGTFVGSDAIADPRAVEVVISVVSTQGAMLLRDGSISRDEAVSRFGKTFTRSVSIPSASPVVADSVP